MNAKTIGPAPEFWEEISQAEWKRRNNSIEPGVYRTTDDIPVPGKPDKRLAREWRNTGLPRGTLVYVRRSDPEGITSITPYNEGAFPRDVSPRNAWFPRIAEKLARPATNDMDGRFAELWFAADKWAHPPSGRAASALQWLWVHSFIDDLALTRALEGDADEDGE